MTRGNGNYRDPMQIGYETAYAGSPEETSSTWQWTLIILVCLVLAGFLAGFAVRGTAIADTKRPQIADAVLDARGTTSLFPSFVAGADEIMPANTFGSRLPDELLAVHNWDDGRATGIVKLHRANPDGSHQLRFIDIAQDGSIDEWVRRDFGDQADQSFAFGDAGNVIIGTPLLSALRLANIARDGETTWSRRIELGASPARAPDLFVRSDRLIVFSQLADLEAGVVMALDMGGAPIWTRRLTGAENSNVAVSESGQVFVASMTSNEERAELVALDQLGNTSWKTPLWLQPGETLAGIISGPDGGATILVSGEAPTLLKFSPAGELLRSEIISGFPDDIELDLTRLEASKRVLISGTTQSMSGPQTLHLKVYSDDSRAMAIEQIELPTGTALRSVTERDSGALLLSGSMRQDLFSDADIFFQEVSLSIEPAPLELAETVLDYAAEKEIGRALEVASAPVVEEEDQMSISSEPLRRVELPSEDPASDAAQDPVLIAASPVEQANPPQPSPAPETPQRAARARPVIARFIEQGKDVRPVSLNDALAQCRFTCLSSSDASDVFPIWQTVPMADVGEPTALAAAHRRSCAAANGTVSMSEARCIPSN